MRSAIRLAAEGSDLSKAAVSTPPAEAGEEAPKKKSKQKLVLLAIPLLLVAVLAGLWFGGILPPLLGTGGQAAAGPEKPGDIARDAAEKAKAPVFVDLPDLIANLNVGQRRSAFIKLKAKLELSKAEDQPIVAAAMPRIQDMFTTYLREMRPEELRGSAGTYRLREELIARANIAVAPAQVVDVLFSEMLIQ
jgi:flagellar protein FliL